MMMRVFIIDLDEDHVGGDSGGGDDENCDGESGHGDVLQACASD